MSTMENPIKKVEGEIENPVENQDSPVVKGISDVTLGIQDVDDEAKKIKGDVLEGVGQAVLDSEEAFNAAVSKIGIPGHGV